MTFQRNPNGIRSDSSRPRAGARGRPRAAAHGRPVPVPINTNTTTTVNGDPRATRGDKARMVVVVEKNLRWNN